MPSVRVRAAGLALALTMAGCRAATPRPAAAPLDGSPPVAVRPGPAADDWTTFAHDQLRSGFQPQATGLTRRNVARLRLRWRYETGSTIQASPLVAGGRVYAATSQGTLYVLDAASGALVWKRTLDATIAMTPALADGVLFIGDHRPGGAFMALDARDGTTLWQTPFPGGVRSEPVIAAGVVYEGETGGDPPECRRGGVSAFDERTGRPRWRWNVDPHDHAGGSVWSPLGYDRGHVIFGTGNACENGVDTADAVVSLGPGGTPGWTYPTARSATDSDVGGGTLLLHGHAIVTSKNGTLYDIDERSGALDWSTPLARVPGYGGIGTPSSDGKTIVASAGFTSDPTRNAPPGGALYGLDTAGNVRWTIATKHPIDGSASITGGMAFTPLDESFAAVALDTGERLWRYDDGHDAYASPAVVPSGVYFANTGGQIFAFSIPRRK